MLKLFFVVTLLLPLLLVSHHHNLVEANNEWQFMGPGSTRSRGNQQNHFASAANAAVKVGDAWLLATVNSGVYRTTASTNDPNPNWVNVFDNQPVTCSSMTTLHVSSTNPNTIVYAACGASSSAQIGFNTLMRASGDFAGFAKSTDTGLTWKMAAFPPNYSVEGILELPNGDVVVAVRGNFFDKNDGGIWTSSNIFDANSWSHRLSIPSYSLAYDNTTNTIYSSSAAVDGSRGVYASTDNGRTWSPFSNGLVFGGGEMITYYSCLTIIPGKAVFLGVLLMPPEFEAFGLGGSFGAVYFAT